MNVLRRGASGNQVKAWQYFLRGQGCYNFVVDGEFGPITEKATKNFQKKHKLFVDGIVGNKTMGKAMQLGFDLLYEASFADEYSGSWPPPPDFKPLTDAGKKRVFGDFKYRPASKTGEGIVILGDWVKENITRVEIPQLKGVRGTQGAKSFFFHVKAAPKVQELFQAWEDAALTSAVLTWAGSWVPRFIRGSRTTLSNHAFGTAFDINVAWNYLGTQPALRGEKGSVRELVPIANDLGWYWGGHFSRRDGMHLELARL